MRDEEIETWFPVHVQEPPEMPAGFEMWKRPPYQHMNIGYVEKVYSSMSVKKRNKKERKRQKLARRKNR